MNLLVPQPARLATVALALTLFATSLACRPENDVEPGPPVLKKLTIVQVTPGGPSPTDITAETGDCPGSAAEGAACDPMTDVFCRQVSADNWCSCAGTDPMDPTVGAWTCPPFSNVAAVIATFDRLLDTGPFTDPDGEPMAIDDAASATSMGMPVAMSADYVSNGAEPGLVFPLYGRFVFGNFRQDGPTVLAAPQPAFHSGSAVTVELNALQVRAKDMQSGFVGTGLLQDGVITFSTAPFAGQLSEPDPTAQDPTAVVAGFTNFIDPMSVGPLTTATVDGAPAEIETSTVTGTELIIRPVAGWPSGSTVVVTIDATAPNVVGQMLGAPVTLTFTAP